MSEEKKVACVMMNSRGANGKPVIWHLPVSTAILEIERGGASCSIPIEELKRLQHAHLYGELEMNEKIKNLEKQLEIIQNSLSFFISANPKIEKLMINIQNTKRLLVKNWMLIISTLGFIGTMITIQQGGMTFLKAIFKPTPPASVLNQTSSGLSGSGEPYYYQDILNVVKRLENKA